MKLKKITISLLTAMIITSTLTGCAAGSSNDLLKMLENNESIEIIVAEPEFAEAEQGTEQTQEWIALALRDNNLDFRLQVDQILNIISYNTIGKNGVLYVNEKGEHTDNSTMYNAFMNQAFIDNYWNNEDVRSQLETVKAYGDTNKIERDVDFINGYFNLFDVNTGGNLYLNPSTTVTRAEFLSAVYKSYNPVQEDLELNEDLVYYMNDDENIKFVSQMLDNSYLNMDDYSMNDKTYDASISKAEAVYTIVKTFYSEEYDKTTGSETLEDFTNGGDIATEQGVDKTNTNCWKAAELVYGIENDVLPQDLYRAMVVAEKHGLLDDMMEEGTTFDWSDGITKAESIRLIIDTFETLGKENGYNTNSEAGTASIEDEITGDYDAVMQSMYNSLSCLQHVTYDQTTGVYSWTEEWETAVTSFDYFHLAPDDMIQEYLKELAEEGYNSYNGETVYNKLLKLDENGDKLYTPPVESEPERQESQSEKQEQSPSSDSGNNENGGGSGSSDDSGWEDEGGLSMEDLEAADEATSAEWESIPEDEMNEELDPTFELIPHSPYNQVFFQ